MFVVVSPVAARAEDNAGSGTMPPISDTSGSVSTDRIPPLSDTPGPVSTDRTPPQVIRGAPPEVLREQLRVKATADQLRVKAENLDRSVPLREKLINGQKPATSSRPLLKQEERKELMKERAEIREERKEDMRDLRVETRERLKQATGTDERREIRRDMRKDTFQIRKEALVKQIGISIENLKQIRERISSRIEKAAAAGRDMTAAKTALATADTKIKAAIDAFEAFKSYTPLTPSTGTTTEQIDLAKPRQIADAALKAVKSAHEALVATVRAIAHAMGLGNTGPAATSTPPTAPATTTATTTTP